ncbi:probable carboxylesterase 15 [Olea europaea var. sylvestris]|uniref:probable carboxylesterase 15 n=1 Tax=Olea europaea var. sylvestris TaxID=158386 RepID=UPI000C1D85CA|nr:probable carboxylesterase 15 [Olea europaea var. sylvestris]
MGSLAHLVEDCLGIVQVYSDGSIFRSEVTDFHIKVHDDGSAIWKDCLFDKKHNLYLRLYKPRSASNSAVAAAKLPILYFFHGGGFCFGSRTWPNFHNSCLRLSSALPAVVISPDYRLAPEHRLPAAMDDAFSAVKWLQTEALSNSADPWLDGVDFDRVFIVGDSSGGNLAHHLAVKLGPSSPGLNPIRVRGYVLMAPFFGGTDRTKSEVEAPEPYLNLEILDRFWRLSVPAGDTADHPLANPFGPYSPNLESIMLDPILVMAGECEVMKDRIEDYAKRLKELGKNIKYVEYQGKQHGFFTNDPFSDFANKVLEEIRYFMSENSQVIGYYAKNM